MAPLPSSMALRAFMPALANKTYFNYGGQGPLPIPALEAIQPVGKDSGTRPLYQHHLAVHHAQTDRLRTLLADRCGVGTHRLAFTENVTSGCVLPLWGLPWQPDDELLIGDCEHPGVVSACQELARRQGCSTTVLAVQALCRDTPAERLDAAVLDAVDQALTPRTRLVVLSHLVWNTGSVMPIEAVAARLSAHPNQPWLLVDAAQSMGSLPVQAAAAAADIYAFTGHKWCCGPEGLGGVALSERLLEEARPTLIGWRSLSNEGEAGSGFHQDARRFEVATSCTPLLCGLATSLELLEGVGSETERLDQIRTRSHQLWQGLQGIAGIQTLLPEPPPAGLVSFLVEADAPETIVRQLGEQGVWLRSLDDPHCLRACTHITTTSEEVERLLAALEQ